MTCRIDVLGPTVIEGQFIAVSGASPALGSWDTSRAIYLSASGSAQLGLWTGVLPLQDADTKFKLVVLDRDGKVVAWEPLKRNRKWPAEAGGGPGTRLRTRFGKKRMKVEKASMVSTWINSLFTCCLAPEQDHKSELNMGPARPGQAPPLFAGGHRQFPGQQAPPIAPENCKNLLTTLAQSSKMVSTPNPDAFVQKQLSILEVSVQRTAEATAQEMVPQPMPQPTTPVTLPSTASPPASAHEPAPSPEPVPTALAGLPGTTALPADQEAEGEQEAQQQPWFRKPSVATWLQLAPKSCPTAAEPAACSAVETDGREPKVLTASWTPLRSRSEWAWLPSVGTWAPVVHKVVTCQPEEARPSADGDLINLVSKFLPLAEIPGAAGCYELIDELLTEQSGKLLA